MVAVEGEGVEEAEVSSFLNSGWSTSSIFRGQRSRKLTKVFIFFPRISRLRRQWRRR